MFCKLRQAIFQKQTNRSRMLRKINRFKNLSANKNHPLNLSKDVTFSLERKTCWSNTCIVGKRLSFSQGWPCTSHPRSTAFCRHVGEARQLPLPLRLHFLCCPAHILVTVAWRETCGSPGQHDGPREWAGPGHTRQLPLDALHFALQ